VACRGGGPGRCFRSRLSGLRQFWLDTGVLVCVTFYGAMLLTACHIWWLRVAFLFALSSSLSTSIDLLLLNAIKGVLEGGNGPPAAWGRGHLATKR
jgi:hypothetical protein